MLPDIAQLEFDDETTTTSSTTVHKTFDWDFDAGDFRLKDGKLVELTSLDYLKVWIQKALRTTRNSFIYADTGYGSEHQSLQGTTLKSAYIKSEYERLIYEALMQNDAITQVDNVSFKQDGARLIISFDVSSIYGTTLETVII